MPPHGSPQGVVARMLRWRADCDGTVAVTFGLLLLPALVAIGVGFDVVRASSAKIRFDAAFDNAATALRTSAASETAATLRARMQRYLDLAAPSSTGGRVTLQMSDPLRPVVLVSATTAVPTTLMQLAGIKSLPLRAAAQVVRQHPPGSQATTDGSGEDDGRAEEERARAPHRNARDGLWLRQDFGR